MSIGRCDERKWLKLTSSVVTVATRLEKSCPSDASPYCQHEDLQSSGTVLSLRTYTDSLRLLTSIPVGRYLGTPRSEVLRRGSKHTDTPVETFKAHQYPNSSLRSSAAV